MNVDISNKVKQQTLEMVVTRADGRVENWGVVGYWHRNPIKRLQFRAACLLKRFLQ